MPIAPPNSPLLDLMYSNQPTIGDTVSREDMMLIQREQEARLLGTFFIQAIFLSLAIMLYATWDWSQFGQPWRLPCFTDYFLSHYKQHCISLTEPCSRTPQTIAKNSSV